jgi:hypothetical protein
MSHELDETISVMHMLFAELLKQCAAVEEGNLDPKDFNESVVAAAESVIAVKRARIARMRQEMGDEPDEE